MSTITAESILTRVKAGDLTIDEAQVQLGQLKLADLKKLTYKVSPKGCICFYGIRRMPISLYSEELQAIVDVVKTEEFQAFLSDNNDKLTTKNKNE